MLVVFPASAASLQEDSVALLVSLQEAAVLGTGGCSAPGVACSCLGL
jgi:hypothetical protein